MYKHLFSTCVILCYSLLLNSCKTTKLPGTNESAASVPQASREFRAAWVATVSNINWPSKPGLPAKQQQQEAIALLDFLQKHNFNAVIFQVRPQADALYQSNLEPWSYYLTGKQGQAPAPYYDPLEFWIKEAHDRGIELHVWLNPYRAHHRDGKEISEQSIIKKHPELVMKLKEGYWWMDPAKKGTQEQTTAVVMDLVKRYDIDGVHFDDYFYPYPSYNGNEDFPDNDSWAEYQRNGGKLSRGDWRRKSVNDLIENLYKKIKNEKPYVKFGLSPFGIWRPGYPASIEGLDQYDKLYADAKLWLNKGWIDYFSPQLYWPINRIPQSYPVLLGWWANENTKKRHLWPGINVGRDTSFRTVNETLSQIMISRGMLPESNGVVHWSISSLTLNKNMADAVLAGPYKKQALVPSSTWLDNTAPDAPVITQRFEGDKLKVSWNTSNANDVFRYVVYYKYGENWNYKIVNRNERSFELNKTLEENSANAKQTLLTEIAVTSVDRVGKESVFKTVHLNL